ncbi:MAG: hypothetical protein ACP5T9_06395, partial [Thermoplasmata archaeon]
SQFPTTLNEFILFVISIILVLFISRSPFNHPVFREVIRTKCFTATHITPMIAMLQSFCIRHIENYVATTIQAMTHSDGIF